MNLYQNSSDTETFPPLYGIQAKTQSLPPELPVKLPPLEDIINKLVGVFLILFH